MYQMSKQAGDQLLELKKIYDDCYEVADYDSEKEVYLTSFEKNDLIYTFIGEKEEEGFSFYSITKKEEGNS